mgnify:CR=1 FL=1
MLTLIDGAETWTRTLATRPDDERFARILKVFADARLMQWTQRDATYVPGASTQLLVYDLELAQRDPSRSWSAAVGRVQPIFIGDVARAFVVAGEHAAQHHEVGTAAEGLGDVPGRRAPAVRADLPLEAVRGVGAGELAEGAPLRVAIASSNVSFQPSPSPMHVMLMPCFLASIAAARHCSSSPYVWPSVSNTRWLIDLIRRHFSSSASPATWSVR